MAIRRPVDRPSTHHPSLSAKRPSAPTRQRQPKVSRRLPSISPMTVDLPITDILAHASAGAPAAIDGLIPRIYATLRRLAHRQRMHEQAHTLDTTALVHEAWLQLAGKDAGAFTDRAHLFAYMSQAVR